MLEAKKPEKNHVFFSACALLFFFLLLLIVFESEMTESFVLYCIWVYKL